MSQTLPEINYLAKDYASFRRLMLERLALLLPDGIQDQPADLQVALVELLAYTADHLSYYQDAVATEAYLGTARSRVSLRRHARLLNYPIHEGCNARVWISCCVQEEQEVSCDWRFLTAGPNPIIFEPCHYPRLYPQHNLIKVHSCTERSAVLMPQESSQELRLNVGDLLLLETSPAGTDLPLHHVVRLTDVGPANGDMTRVSWSTRDALPFFPPVACALAQGNIVLADHGLTLDPQQLVANPCLHLPAGVSLTYVEPMPAECFRPGENTPCAADLLKQDVRRALPQIKELRNTESSWTPCRDLLESGSTDAVFVAETEQDGSVSLRFGDGKYYGRRPMDPGFRIRYRVGNGQAGNVGAESICRVEGSVRQDVTVRNPLPAQGGEDPEAAEQVRIFAPQAFRIQRRAINAEDYAARARSFPGVRDAKADFRWTGSWYTVYLFINRQDDEAIDMEFKEGLLHHLDSYRLAGYDLEIRGATYVPLTIRFTFEVKPGFTPNVVLTALEEALSSDTLPGDRRGYFHPDNWTFGQPVYLSHFYKAVLSVPGLAALDVSEFRRKATSGETARTQGTIEIGAHEIVSHEMNYQQDELWFTVKESA